MNTSQLKSLIDRRKEIFRISGDEWNDGITKVDREMLKQLAENPDETIDYLAHSCTDEEFYWLSEIFDYLAVKFGTGAKREQLNQVLRKRLEEVQDPEERKLIKQDVEEAENIIDIDEL